MLRKNGFVKIANIFRRVISLFTTNLIFLPKLFFKRKVFWNVNKLILSNDLN